MENVDSEVAALLVAWGRLDRFKLHAVRDVQTRRGGRLHRLVVEMGFVDEAAATEALAQVLSLKQMSLQNRDPDPRAIALIDAGFCRQYTLLPFAIHGDSIALVMADPSDEAVLAEARSQTGRSIHPLVGAPSEIAHQIECHYSQQGSALPVRPPLPSEAELSQGTAASGVLTIEQRLERIFQNQKKSARIISGLTKLLVEKGLFSNEELSRQQR